MKSIHIIHLGIGNVGREIVRQILRQREYLQRECNIDLQYCGLFNSKGGVFNKDGLSFEEMRDFPFRLNAKAEELIQKIDDSTILIDTTASDKTYSSLKEALKRGGYVVLSNKKPLTRSQKEFDELVVFAKERILFETTVGAGLPIISTIKSLMTTGDEIVEINGCFSGTLGFIFSSLEDGLNFSQAVKLAKEKGFTEPDPRDDLSGLDVARKALILARLIGQKIELSDITLQKLYPPELENASVEQFMFQIPSLDNDYKKRIIKAQKNGRTLRYVAQVTNNHCTSLLQEVSKSSDIGYLKGPDNIISVKTKLYFDHPLLIKGPGAGREVTAAGVFGDILLAAQRI